MTDDDFLVAINKYAGFHILELEVWAMETSEFKACKRAYENYEANRFPLLDSTWIWKSRIQSLCEGGVGALESKERQNAIRQAKREYEEKVRELEEETRRAQEAREKLNRACDALAKRLQEVRPRFEPPFI